MNIAFSFFMSMLSLMWSFLCVTKLHIVLIAQIILETAEVSPTVSEKIMMGVGVIWLILVISPVVNGIRGIIGK